MSTGGLSAIPQQTPAEHSTMTEPTPPATSPLSTPVQAIGLVVFLALCLGAGALGAIVTTPEIGGWYQTLTKPSWNPPAAVFGPVWTTLYILMAVAAWLVWRQAGLQPAAVPLAAFAVQLVLNIAWSWIFFGGHQPGWAFAEIVVLWVVIVATTILFARRSRWASALLVPYLAWVTFASALNFTLWQLNPNAAQTPVDTALRVTIPVVDRQT